MNNYYEDYFCQTEFIKRFNEDKRENFNPELFVRNDNDIVEEIMKSILSCQRNNLFTLKVDSFKVIEDYATIMKMLEEYDERVNGNNRKRKVNQYEYINLKDSDVKLLVVRYYIRVKENFEYVDVYILIPRIVDKYYFRISGNVYYAMYQIVDGSTYNNSTSTNSKSQNITLKTEFMPVKLNRNVSVVSTIDGEELKLTNYKSMIFNKRLYGLKYMLAKFGLYGTMNYMGINCLGFYNHEVKNPDLYTIEVKGIYITVPKMILDADIVTQALVDTIYADIHKHGPSYEELFTREYWLSSLGSEFNNYNSTKGESVLNSLEGVYDISTKESIRLPEEHKKDIYAILRWMIREFPYLRAKSNLDLSTKKVRYSEYIASLYAMCLCRSIYRLSDINKRVTLEAVKKSVIKRPTYLLDEIVKCRLVNYRGLVNDLDSLIATKYTYKGISGMGEKNSKVVPQIYRSVQVSDAGRLDIDSSPKSDPGMGGIICPMTKLYNGSFSEFEEPNYWEKEFEELMNNYKSLVSLKEIVTFKQEVLGMDTSEKKEELEESIGIAKNLISIVKKADESSEYCGNIVEEGGKIYIE